MGELLNSYFSCVFSRILGYTNIVTTQIYARITTQKLDNDLTMLAGKLNASFGNIKIA